MAILDDIAAERERLTDRLARIDAERTRLAEQLSELETAERVMSRFGSKPAAPGQRRRAVSTEVSEAATATRGRRARSAAGTTGAAPTRTRQQRRAHRKTTAEAEVSLGDATLRAVEALGNDVSAERVRTYLAEELGMQVRPNHLGMALQRHRRSGRLEQHGENWCLPAHQSGEGIATK